MTKPRAVIDYPLYVAGKAVETSEWLEVQDKYTHKVCARVSLADAKILKKPLKQQSKPKRKWRLWSLIRNRKSCCTV